MLLVRPTPPYLCTYFMNAPELEFARLFLIVFDSFSRWELALAISQWIGKKLIMT